MRSSSATGSAARRSRSTSACERRAGRDPAPVQPALLNGGGLLLGPVGFALVDYSMASALWAQRNPGELIATINVSLNFIQSASEGELACIATVDRRNRTPRRSQPGPSRGRTFADQRGRQLRDPPAGDLTAAELSPRAPAGGTLSRWGRFGGVGPDSHWPSTALYGRATSTSVPWALSGITQVQRCHGMSGSLNILLAGLSPSSARRRETAADRRS